MEAPGLTPVPASVASPADRDLTADDRDRGAAAQDIASSERDARSDARDLRAVARERDSGHTDPTAAADRAGAWRDRQSSAADRIHAQNDRQAASMDRQLAREERATLLVDRLTGARRREAGLDELRRDVARARRLGEPYVLAFLDVDGLKATNDTRGHAAGDEVLRHVAATVRAAVRSYDLLVRYGGDEFLCGFLGLETAQARARFEAVDENLGRRGLSVSVGLVAWDGDETTEALVARADAAMYVERAATRRLVLPPLLPLAS